MFALLLLPLLAATYDVGPGLEHEHPLTVPWESLKPGDEVVIRAREQPYRMKWVLGVAGTKEQPIVVRGVRDNAGNRPVFSGEDALTPPRLVYNGGARSLLKIGASSVPTDTMPEHLVIDNIEFRDARPAIRFYGRRGEEEYVNNAAGLFIEKGRNIVVRRCRFTGCGNGLFVAPETAHLAFEACEFEGNGVVDSIYEHNVYTSSVDIAFVGCRFGPLADGALGNNLKDRSGGLTVANCWIEGGNRQLDLVDAQNAVWIAQDPTYRTTWVVGNVLIESEPRLNNQIIHYGGDSGETQFYRKGTLKLWFNTILSQRPKATVLRLSTGDELADLRGNLIHTVNGGSHIAILDDLGRVNMDTNWIRRGYRRSFGSQAGIFEETGTVVGSDPLFVDVAGRDLRLAEGSTAVDAGPELLQVPWQADDALGRQFAWPAGTSQRVDPAPVNFGALGVTREPADWPEASE